MSLEKRLVAAAAQCLAMVLLTCTVEAQLIYWQLLPRVEPVEAVWQDDGFTLPQSAVFAGPQGDCVYRIEEKQGRFGPEYRLQAVLVTVLARSGEEVSVRGLYAVDWQYAANADAPLQDGGEVALRG